MELQRDLQKATGNVYGYTTGVNVLKPYFFLLVNNCIDFWRWPYHISAGYKRTSQPACAVMSFLIKSENPLEGKKKSLVID